MKKTILTLAAAGMLLVPQTMQAKVEHLLPKPQEITAQGGALALTGAVSISDPTDCAALRKFFTSMGCTLADGGIPVTVTRVAAIDGAYDYELYGFDNEAYTLEVTASGISIKAVTRTGVIRAAQTLAQLAEGYEGTPSLETVTVKDWPAFKLRGYTHDVGRSYIDVAELKKHIDLLSRFKVNCFHWHMTENQAWRMQIKAYPKLTESAYMTRFAGKYYTQEECKEVAAYAAERGVVVIPEIDMPGHSEAFERAMGFDMQSTQGMEVLKKVLDEVAEVFADVPYIHIGADEKTITNNTFLKTMTDYVHAKNKKVVVWNPIRNVNVSTVESDMTQMWSSSGSKIAGRANIDCRYNYANHFDVFADVVGIYKSNIYYAEKGNAEVAGTISAYWNDRKTATQEDIVKQNNFYANVLASAERAWIGGGKAYIEAGGTTLPGSGEEHDQFVDWERRFLFHKAHSLKDEPIPYVRQTNVRWRITDAFPNGGDASKVFAPETQGKAEGTEMMPESFTHEGRTYYTGMATGAGIYLRHTWGNNTVPTFYGSTNYSNSTAYAWTYVYSPEAQTVGAQIEFQNYGRSENDKAPDAGKWDRKGSDIWINGQRINPPTWENSGKNINAEVDLKNENFSARTPVRVNLKQGWNKVFLKLPYVAADGVRLNKWMFTCVFTDTEGKNAVEGLIYSPNQCKDEATEKVAAEVSAKKRAMGSYVGTAVGLWPVSKAEALSAKITEIEATYQTTMTEEQRAQQIADLEAVWTAFQAGLTPETMNQPQADKYYRMSTPLRGNRYPTAKGAGQALVGEETFDANSSVWKFVAREDGSYDIRNYYDLTYVSPASGNNTALNTVNARPAAGWTLKQASTMGYVIITSNTAQFNQTNNANQGFKVFNWGGGNNVTDTGCQYLIEEVTVDPANEGGGVPEESELPFKTTTIVDGRFAQGTMWYTMQIGSSQNIISNNGTAENIALQRTQTSLEDADLWCFVGDKTNGYKIYNKQAGPTKILAAETEMKSVQGFGGTGGGTYPVMMEAESLPANCIGAWDLQSSDKIADVEGFFLYQHGTSHAMNNFGGRGYLAFWAEGQDAGSTVSITFAEATLEIKPANGTFTSSNANKTWHATWESTQMPGLTLSTGANNMTTENGYIAAYSGKVGSCTHTLTAPEGLVVAGYSFDYTNTGKDGSYSLNLTVGGTTYKTNATTQHLDVTDLKDRIATYGQSGDNMGVTLSNYYVTVRRSLVEPEPQFDVFQTPDAQAIPYRIPAIARAYNGNIVAVADYRHSRADIGMATNGRIDIRGRISKDNGKNWDPVFTIVEGQGAAAAANNSMYVAFGDPCLVADSESPKMMMLTCSGNVSFPNGQRNNHQGIARFYSEDNGETWGTPVDISESIYEQFDQRADGGIRCMFIGSGKISQSKTVKVGSHYRLYCAPLVKLANGSNVNFVLYSDDFGGTWKVLGGVENTPIPSGGDEPKADEMPDGSVVISSRTTGGRIYNVYTFTDVEKGEGSWADPAWSNAANNGTVAISNACNGEIMFLPVKRVADDKPMYMALQSVPFGSGRANVGIYYKALESLADFANPDSLAKDWDGRHQASYLPSAYSTFCLQADNTIGFLYEESTYCTAGGGYNILYKNYSVEQLTDSAYTYCAEASAADVVRAGIDLRRVQAGEGRYVGEYTEASVAAVDEAIEAYKAAPTGANYVAINRALARAERTGITAGQAYRLRNIDRQDGTLYLMPEASRFTAAAGSMANADQVFAFAPAANDGEFYLYNPNYDLYLGKLVAQETQPVVTANVAEAATWRVESRPTGESKLINVNRQSGGLDGLHLAGDNQRLVPWYSTSEASQWYVEIVSEMPVTVPAAGYTTANLPFAFRMPEGMKAYTVVEPTLVNDILCLYIEEVTLVDGAVPANTPVVLVAEAGDYALQVAGVSAAPDAAADAHWCGTLRAATVAGTVYTLDGDALAKSANGSVAANSAYYTNESLGVDRLPLSVRRGVAVGIDNIDGEAADGVFYDLSGRRVVRPQSGIYVVNGRKVLVK